MVSQIEIQATKDIPVTCAELLADIHNWAINRQIIMVSIVEGEQHWGDLSKLPRFQKPWKTWDGRQPARILFTDRRVKGQPDFKGKLSQSIFKEALIHNQRIARGEIPSHEPALIRRFALLQVPDISEPWEESRNWTQLIENVCLYLQGPADTVLRSHLTSLRLTDRGIDYTVDDFHRPTLRLANRSVGACDPWGISPWEGALDQKRLLILKTFMSVGPKEMETSGVFR